MQTILVTGAGKIGTLIACLLAQSGDYAIVLTDIQFGEQQRASLEKLPNLETVVIDATDASAMSQLISAKHIQAVISSLPFFCNIHIAKLAQQHSLHYFDLTEDVNVTTAIQALAEGAQQAFVPQCGLAPGFISIVANDLMQSFQRLEAVKLRVGALPVNVNNALHYAMTWSIDGLINEYGNPCYGIRQGKKAQLQPLEGLEEIQLDGLSYEAFNTSGGLGSLADSYEGKTNHMTYKTIRYPGHCKKMRLLMHDLKLNHDRATLKHILENAIPKTGKDVVLIYVSVTGEKQGELIEENYVNKIYPQSVSGQPWSAIQITTAASVCAIVDKVLSAPQDYAGLILQEHFSLNDFLANRFGQYYAHQTGKNG